MTQLPDLLIGSAARQPMPRPFSVAGDVDRFRNHTESSRRSLGA
jgi:hypothetical protein